LPDNVVACGVHAALLDSQGGALCEASAPCLSSSPDVRSPRFHLRLELRPSPDPNANSNPNPNPNANPNPNPNPNANPNPNPDPNLYLEPHPPPDLELRRGDEMPADATLVISVVAVQEGTEAEGLRQVGFGAIAPFAGCSGSADAGKQPSSSFEREVGSG